MDWPRAELGLEPGAYNFFLQVRCLRSSGGGGGRGGGGGVSAPAPRSPRRLTKYVRPERASQALKEYTCGRCMCVFGCMSAKHECPHCRSPFACVRRRRGGVGWGERRARLIDRYFPRDYHRRVSCDRCGREFGFKQHAVSARRMTEARRPRVVRGMGVMQGMRLRSGRSSLLQRRSACGGPRRWRAATAAAARARAGRGAPAAGRRPTPRYCSGAARGV